MRKRARERATPAVNMRKMRGHEREWGERNCQGKSGAREEEGERLFTWEVEKKPPFSGRVQKATSEI